MFTHILIPTDGSVLAGRAVDEGLALALALRARVTFVTAIEPFQFLYVDASQLGSGKEQYEAAAEANAREMLRAAAAKAEALGVPADTVHVWSDEPYRAIVDTARERGCDLIAIASHGRRGVAALVLGSQTTKVLAHARVPVLVFR